MSYSFSVTAKSKDEAKKAVEAELDKVIQNQPAHAADRAAAVAAAGLFIDLLKDVPEDSEVNVSMHGSIGWNHDAPDQFTGAGVGVSAMLRKVA